MMLILVCDLRYERKGEIKLNIHHFKYNFSYVTDATPAMLIAILCFLYPSEKPDFFCWRGGCGRRDDDRKPGPREPLITWDVVAHKLPWGLILLLGGGFALADSISVRKQYIGLTNNLL